MNRAEYLLNSEWIRIGEGIGNLRSDRSDLVVDNFFRWFTPHFSGVGSWKELAEHVKKQPVLLLLDDLGEMLKDGACALLPGIIETAVNSKGRLRVIATLRDDICNLLRARGVENPKYHSPWKTLSVLPFKTREQALALLSLLPPEVYSVTQHRYTEIRRLSGLRPQPIQCLAHQLWRAHKAGEDTTRLGSLILDKGNYYF